MEERRGEERGRRELRIRGKRGKNWHSANLGYSGDLLLCNQQPQNGVAQNNYFLLSLMLLWVDGAQLGSSLVISQAATARWQLQQQLPDGSTGLDGQHGSLTCAWGLGAPSPSPPNEVSSHRACPYRLGWKRQEAELPIH